MHKRGLVISIRGRFRVRDADGRHIALRGAKESALLILLAYSEGHERSRVWLIDKLWSDRFTDQGRTSLRQVLKNLRKALGPHHADYLFADRTYVRLACDVTLEDDDALRDSHELFEDIDVRDPEFEDWIRDLRQRDGGAPTSGGQEVVPAFDTTTQNRQRQVQVGLTIESENASPEEGLIAQTLIDSIAGLLNDTGTIRPCILDRSGGSYDPHDFAAFVELHCLSKDDDWFTHVRVTPRNRQHFSWSGRLRLPMKFAAVWESPDLTAFAHQVMHGLTKTLGQTAPRSPFVTLNRAIQMLYSGEASRIMDADRLLQSVVSETGVGVALAWRSYARLTNALEFGAFDQQARMEAEELLREALDRSPASALARGLASIVQTKLLGDPDYGFYLAERAVAEDDRNAYALDAYSQALFFRGEHDRSYHVSEWARGAARHSPHAYNWDMRCALAALSLGRMDDALELAKQSHMKAPQYRPALRYLYALNVLAGDDIAADHYAQVLERHEPGFAPKDILDDDYPMETFKWLGLHENLALSDAS